MLKDISGASFGYLTVIKLDKSNSNRYTKWICRCACGKVLSVFGGNLRTGHSRSCGYCNTLTIKRRTTKIREKSHRWNGGKCKDKRGYVYLTRLVENGSVIRKSIAEHIHVMSKHIGRSLAKGETVHHKNGIKWDNRIENLELWASSHPSGQRISDLVDWAKNILMEYSPDSLVK